MNGERKREAERERGNRKDICRESERKDQKRKEGGGYRANKSLDYNGAAGMPAMEQQKEEEDEGPTKAHKKPNSSSSAADRIGENCISFLLLRVGGGATCRAVYCCCTTTVSRENVGNVAEKATVPLFGYISLFTSASGGTKAGERKKRAGCFDVDLWLSFLSASPANKEE